MSDDKKNIRLSNQVRQAVIETVHDVISDSEYGKELRDWVKKRLSKYDSVDDYSRFNSLEETNN